MSKHHHACLSLVLAALVAAPASAQLLDATQETATEQKQQATEAPPRKRPVERSEAKDQVAIETQASPDPPASIARRQEPSQEAPADEGPNTLLTLFLSLLGVALVLFIAARARSWITTNIPLRRVLGALVFVLRVAGLALLLAIVLNLVPSGQNWILWTLAVLGLVIGWSVRDLFADLVAGAILAAERRVKKGMWVSGEGFQGTVEGRSLRATWLRDGQGHRLTVPNRAMVGAPMVYDAGSDAEHEVVVRLEGYRDAGKVRIALTDAILSSPWVLAGATPVVLRDPADPVVWRVRMKLLEPRFSVHFEGELLERVEDLLRYEPVADEPETVPGELEPED